MRQQMCDIDKSAGTLFFAVARSLPTHTAQYVYVYTYSYIHAIHWRSYGVMKNSYKIFSLKAQTKKSM